MSFITDAINKFGIIPCVVFAAIVVFILWMLFSKKGPGSDTGGQGGQGGNGGPGPGSGTTPPPPPPAGP